MVCLYTTLINVSEELNLYSEDGKDFKDWNWLCFRLSQFIFNKSNYNNAEIHEDPYAVLDEHTHTSLWVTWFRKVVAGIYDLGFDDATPERVMKCLNNTPTEEIAEVAVQVTSIDNLMEFKQSLEKQIEEKKSEYVEDV